VTAKIHSKAQLIAVMICLTGCSSILGGGGPTRLYRFGDAFAATTAPDSSIGAHARVVGFRGALFPTESSGDRILTTRGGNVAYVADSRWIAPAAELFNSALRGEFARSLSGVRLIGPGEGPRADFALSVDVRRFEAVYESGETPVVTVEANARLIRWTDRAIVGEWIFTSRKPASENRVASIVAAFDQATMEIIDQIRGAVGQIADDGKMPAS
jgi:cholesterol transport system auxiliary component